MTPKAQGTKGKKIKKWDFVKIKIFVLQRHFQESEMTTYRMRGVFANHLSDKGLKIRIYKD